MSAPVSSYPLPVVELLPTARDLAARLGGLPSRNRLMRELKVGAPKAGALREALAVEFDGGPGEVPALAVVDPAGPVSVVVADSVELVGAAGPGVVSAGGVPGVVVDPGEPDVVPGVVVAGLAGVDGHPGSMVGVEVVSPLPRRVRPVRSWPVWLLSLPAFVAIWSGWVGLGTMTGFGVVHPLPGIWDSFSLNTAITLPVGVETYAAFALSAWMSGRVPVRARRFAGWSALGSLVVGSLGQIAYHLMEAAGITHAPWQITTAVACLPVIVLGMGAALAHLIRAHE